MNTYQLLLASGATTYVTAENYNVDPFLGLQFVDQFGNVTGSYRPGAWQTINLVNASQPGTAAQNAYQGTVSDSSAGLVQTGDALPYSDGGL